MSFWDTIRNKMIQRKIDKSEKTDSNFRNARYNSPQGSVTPQNVSVQNAQSWNAETHPEGRGDSQLVNNIDYDANTKNLEVEYRDGFKAQYGNISPAEAKEFSQADSKGRWALKHLWSLPYKKV